MATAISVLDSNQPDSEQASIIGSRVCIQGTILSDQNLQVDGKVEGAIEMHGHRLTVGPRGEVREIARKHPHAGVPIAGHGHLAGVDRHLGRGGDGASASSV